VTSNTPKVARPPDFVGVGAQKAGTSWWHELVIAHPHVFTDPAWPKEMHFFDRFWSVPFADSDTREYAAWFARPDGAFAGEWTPRYMFDPWTPALLARSAPDAKVLVLLRDPIARYQSGVTHSLNHDGLPAIAMVASDAFNRGLYGVQLRRLYSYFAAESVLVLQYERCVAEPAEELARTYEFLGLDASFVPERIDRRVNETFVEKPPLDSPLRHALAEAYQPDLRDLATLVDDLDLSLWSTATLLV
jgi:hypothetical protein